MAMTKKELRYSFNRVLTVAENVTCEDLHHKKAHQHAADEMCPAEYEMHKHVRAVREYMKNKGI